MSAGHKAALPVAFAELPGRVGALLRRVAAGCMVCGACPSDAGTGTVGERLNEYELLYILSPRVPVDEVANAIERVSVLVRTVGGEVTSVDNWGRRRLAYPIRQYFEGTYVVKTLRLPPAGTKGLEAALVISDDVIRHLLTAGIIPRTAGGRMRSGEERERAEPAAEARDEAPELTTEARDEAPEPEAEPVMAAAAEAATGAAAVVAAAAATVE
jgi:small subunit ribosomal protein S6